MHDQRGFSLVEMLIVVAIIGIITAIAVPNLVRAREAADSASAVSSCRTLITAESLYYNSYSAYGTLAELVPFGTLDPALGSGSKADYLFTLTVNNAVTPPAFTINADPIIDSGDLVHYYTDQTMVIRSAQGTPASATSPPI
ncbi:MAG TPA: prepilin-type N-terminal cleavage/methylation domain-containing protein [Blastocatellia bacterium]